MRLAALIAALAVAVPVVARAEPDRAILDRAGSMKPAAIDLWERLVNIDSGTGDSEGVNRIGAIAVEQLKALGAAIEIEPAKPAYGDNIVASFAGTGKGKVLLIAHMDTVFAKGAAAARPFRIDGARAYGPGVIDDKGGIVLALTALKILQDIKAKDFARITLMLNTNEETGSRGSRALIESLAREHDVTLNLEPGRPGDGVVVWRKGSAALKVEVKGVSAHAGVAPESGRNAAMELAHQVLQLSKLADPSKGTTVSFTVLKAGDRTNMIPDHAVAEGDMRSLVTAEFDRVEREMAELSKNRLIPDTEVTTSLRRGFPVMAQNAQTDAVAALAQRVYGEIGRTLRLEGSGGAADSSLAAGVFKPTLDGLGIIGTNLHTDREYAEVDSVVPRLYLLTRMMMELGKGQ